MRTLYGLRICKNCGIQYPARKPKQKLCVLCTNTAKASRADKKEKKKGGDE